MASRIRRSSTGRNRIEASNRWRRSPIKAFRSAPAMKLSSRVGKSSARTSSTSSVSSRRSAARSANGGCGSADVVILSDGFWKRHFGGSPAAIGQTVRIDERPHTIVGVMPSRFTLDGDSEDYFQPLGVDANRGPRFPPYRGSAPPRRHARASARRHVGDHEAARTAVSRLARRGRRQPRADGRRRRAKGQDGPVDDHVGRRRRAADCVRERRQPHARARRHTPAGAGASRRARRRTASSGAAAPHRERRDRRSRRGARPARRTLDRISARRGGGRSISCSRDRECADRRHGAPLHTSVSRLQPVSGSVSRRRSHAFRTIRASACARRPDRRPVVVHHARGGDW